MIVRQIERPRHIPSGLGRKECAEQALRLSGIKSNPGVSHCDENVFRGFPPFGPDRENARNLANIRMPVIAAIERHANVQSEYAMIANVIVAGEGATLNTSRSCRCHLPGDGTFTTWSYRAGAGRAEAYLLNPRPVTARTAHEWGVVAESVPDGRALARAREPATLYLKAPEVTRRNTRAHIIQPLKERIVREVGYGLSLEGASAADLVKLMQARN